MPMMRRCFILLLALLILSPAALAENAAIEDMATAMLPTEELPIDLPVFETDTFLLIDAQWTRPTPDRYWYTFNGTGMDAETIMALMTQTGHTLVEYSADPLTSNPGIGHSIYYTYEGEQPVTLIPFPLNSPDDMFSVIIGFYAYDDGTCKMTLFCSPELMYEPEE